MARAAPLACWRARAKRFAVLVDPAGPSVHYSLTRAKKLALIVADSGLMVDSVGYSAPDPPQNPNPPRSSLGWAHRGAPRRTRAPLHPLVTRSASALSAGSPCIKPTGSLYDLKMSGRSPELAIASSTVYNVCMSARAMQEATFLILTALA